MTRKGDRVVKVREREPRPRPVKGKRASVQRANVRLVESRLVAGLAAARGPSAFRPDLTTDYGFEFRQRLERVLAGPLAAYQVNDIAELVRATAFAARNVKDFSYGV